MDPSVSLNLSQLLFFAVTALVGLVWKNLNDKFVALKDDYNSKIMSSDASFRERMAQIQKDNETRARDRGNVYDGKFSTFEATLQRIDNQLAELSHEMKDLNIGMAKLSMLEEQAAAVRRRPARVSEGKR
jgi:hypothetical protein